MNPYVHNNVEGLVVFPIALRASVGTATASETSTITPTIAAVPLPAKFSVQTIKVTVVTAPTQVTGAVFKFLNGTTTFASASIASKTAGEVVTATAVGYGTGEEELNYGAAAMTPPTGPTVAVWEGQNTSAEIAAGSSITLKAIGTATASADSFGTVDIWVAGKFIA